MSQKESREPGTKGAYEAPLAARANNASQNQNAASNSTSSASASYSQPATVGPSSILYEFLSRDPTSMLYAYVVGDEEFPVELPDIVEVPANEAGRAPEANAVVDNPPEASQARNQASLLAFLANGKTGNVLDRPGSQQKRQ